MLSDLIPSGYDILHTARSGSRGGGVAVVFKQGLNMKKIVSTTNDVHAYTHFEHLDCYVSTGDKLSRLCVIYCPPPSKQNDFTNIMFFDELTSYLDELAVAPQQLIITGDLYFHLDKPDSPAWCPSVLRIIRVTWFSSAGKSCHTHSRSYFGCRNHTRRQFHPSWHTVPR